MKFEIEWDEGKRLENIRRRKVDFRVAAGIFEGRTASAEDTRRTYGEKRYRAIGEVQGRNYVVAYTFRGNVLHIITAWEVGPSGKKRYQTLLAR
jgi:uncharacterized DUF497 family protein